MNGLLDFLKKLKAEENSGRRVIRHNDPSIGIEYNKINATHRVSKKLWKVDIARSPQVIRDLGEYVNVQGEAWLANQMNPMIDYRMRKVHGKGR